MTNEYTKSGKDEGSRQSAARLQSRAQWKEVASARILDARKVTVTTLWKAARPRVGAPLSLAL